MPVFFTKPNRPKLTFITPNWCDKTTWYSDSTRVVEEVAGDSGDHTTYELDHQNVIDNFHGKLSFEDYLKDNSGNSLRVVVLVNGTPKAERDPEVGIGGDFTVDCANGRVTFFSALQPSDEVKVSYSYAGSSRFVVKPTTGKILRIDKVEVQFSANVVMNDWVVFQPYGYVQAFAPELMQPPYNLPENYLIPLGDPLVYKTLLDLINDCNRSYPAYPALGGSNWRGYSQPVHIFAWEYDVGATELHSALGMEVHIDLRHNVPNGGDFATATLYCTTEDEEVT
jgi:hypothetical protein